MKTKITLICYFLAGIMFWGNQAQAQILQSANEGTLPLTEGRTINPTENQAWWGYFGSERDAQGVGVQTADTYHCAIFIPGNHAVAWSKTIHAIRFGIPSSNASNIKVWIANQLPTMITSSKVIEYVSVPLSDLDGGSADVALTNPYTVPASGVYVGYSFKISRVQDERDKYPILVGGQPDPNGLYIRTEAQVPAWSNYSQDFGSLYLQVLLEGQFVNNAATPSGINEVWGKTGESVTTALTVTNGGTEPLQNFAYFIETDGVAGEEHQVNLSNPVAIGLSTEVSVTIPTETEHSRKTKSLVITKVNGQANETENNRVDFLLYSLERSYERNVVVEEFTGTGCGYCPRGLVGMEKLRQTFGDRFVGIGLHQYNSSDAMYIAPDNYAALGFTGAPSCALNRGAIIDPYYGSKNDICDDFRAEMKVPSLVGVQVSGQYDADSTHVHAQAQVEALFDDLKYSLEFVLVADGLSGTASSWKQANYYYTASPSQVPSDLAIFASGGKYGQSSVSGWVFNDVALSSSYVKRVNQVPDVTVGSEQPATVEYTLPLPTAATLKNALHYDEIYAVALLIASDGTIVNAAKAPVSAYSNASGLEQVAAKAATSVVYYDLQGRVIAQPAQGTYLRQTTFSDGSAITLKVTLK